jgi:DNA-binding response OmpR family regulator
VRTTRERIPASEPAIHQPPHALIVEDDPAISRLLEALLSSAGYRVTAVAEGETALAYCAHARPGVVFLDLTLPDISGWDLLARLRALPDPPPVVVLTADSAAVSRARAAGAADAILKPFDIDEVLAIAARLLSQQGAET